MTTTTPTDTAIACSVLVPVYNEQRYIHDSVAAMRRQRFPGELEFLFADGGSTDGTLEILHRLAHEDPRIRVLHNPGQTVSSGLNVALRHARGRWALRMDAHTVYPDDYALAGVRRLEQGGTPWVSGPQVPIGDGPVSRAVALALSGAIGRGGSRKWSRDGAGGEAEFELDTGVFAGVWERGTLIEHGGWDERWVVNEDSEMAARFLERGELLICLPAMAARYAPRDSLLGLWRQYLRYGEFRARTSRRHPGSMRASHLLAPGVVVAAAAAVVAPRRIRRMARLGQAAYAASLVRSGLRCAPAADTGAEAALVPVALLVVHFAHGTGQLRGWLRYGPPLRAVAVLLGLAGAPGPEEGEPVYAPSLWAGQGPAAQRAAVASGGSESSAG
jgi:succinoglycan biosynthesis protein ExoA